MQKFLFILCQESHDVEQVDSLCPLPIIGGLHPVIQAAHFIAAKGIRPEPNNHLLRHLAGTPKFVFGFMKNRKLFDR